MMPSSGNDKIIAMLHDMKTDLKQDVERVDKKVDKIFSKIDDINKVCTETRICNANKFGTIWDRLKQYGWLIAILMGGLISTAFYIVRMALAKGG